MTDTLCRLYTTRSQAEAAAAALREAGYDDVSLFGATVTEDPTREAYLSALTRAGIHQEAASVYADHLLRGASLVVVNPLFGLARRAIGILEEHRPIAVEVPEPPPPPTAARDGLARSPTPFSDWLGWPLLSATKLPFAAMFGWASLVPGRKYYAERWWGGGLLSDKPYPFSARFGWRLLSKDPTPFSSRLGWRLLSNDPTPFSSRFGWRLLSNDPTPFSSRFGWRLLSKEPMPFSTWLGLRPPSAK